MSFSITSATAVAQQVAQETESRILQQLNDFVSRNLIRVELGPMTFVRDPATNILTVEQSVNLRLKDLEYIESLEREVETLRAQLKRSK